MNKNNKNKSNNQNQELNSANAIKQDSEDKQNVIIEKQITQPLAKLCVEESENEQASENSTQNAQTEQASTVIVSNADTGAKKTFTEEVKRAYNYRKQGFNKKDSAFAFLISGFCMPIFVALGFVIILSIISAFSGIEADTLLKTRPYDIISMLCAEIGFVIYFFYTVYSKNHRKQFNNCVGFSFKKFDYLTCIVVVLIAIIMALLCSQFIDVVNYGLQQIGYTKESSLPITVNSVGEMLLGLLVMALIPAICEEFVFRGIVLGGLLNGATTKKAKIICVIISALIFALIHQNALQLVFPFIMGCVFGFVYMYTGNLLYSIILHFVSNGVVVVANYIGYVNGATETAVTYNALYILGAFALLILALALTFGGIVLIRLISKNKSQFLQKEEDIKEYENCLKESEIIVSSLNEDTMRAYALNEKAEQISKLKAEIVGKITLWCGIALGVIIIIVDLITSVNS